MGKKEWKKIRHGIIIFVMAFFSAIPFVVYGKNIDSKETIRIGYIDYGGFIDLDENGEYTGYGVELLDKIAEYTGWKYEYVYDTWDNVLKKLESGEIDMICQAQKTPEREERFLLSKYWAEQKPVFFMQEWMMTGIITMIMRLLMASGWQD